MSLSSEPGRPVSSRRHGRRFLCLGLALSLIIIIWPAHQLRSDNFVVYLPNAHQVIPLESIDRVQYLPLVPLLNLVGTVSGIEEKGNSMKVWLGSNQLELHRGDKKVRINRAALKLSNPVRVSNGQWMAPLDFIDSALPRLTNQRLEYRPGDQRIFIGDVRPTTFFVTRAPLPNGTRLTFHFSDAVTIHTTSSNGRWIVGLGGRPVEPLEQGLKLNDASVSEVRFDDQDGVPKIIITPVDGSLNFYPTVEDQGKQFQADIVQPITAASQTPPGPAPASASSSRPGPTAGAGGAPVSAPAPPPLPAVVLDAGHGGPDPGARSRDGLAEKDLVVQIVERVRNTIAATNQYRVILTRNGDADPTFDERDSTANLAHPVAFLSFHAGNLGERSPRVMVYTYQASAPPDAGADAQQMFVPWAWAQAPHLDQSRQLAGAIAQQMSRISDLSTGNPDQAPVRQLRSVSAPAVAIEVGSLSPELDAGVLATPDFQQQIAAAIVQALAAFRGGA